MISSTQGGFNGELHDYDNFGRSVTALGDLDDDGVVDLAVGAWGDDDGGLNRGAVWVLFLNTDGTVKLEQKISGTHGNFTGMLDDNDRFGLSATGLGDLDNDGVGDLAVGPFRDDGAGIHRGAAWVLLLERDGTVKSHQKINDRIGGFNGTLSDYDNFGRSVAGLGDLDGDGVADLAVGAWGDDDGGADRGAVWVLQLEGAVFPLGDMNCDYNVDAFDITPFLIAVFEPWNYRLLYPDCNVFAGDINGDGSVNSFDIQPFVELLFP
jgi:hypothetical protein